MSTVYVCPTKDYECGDDFRRWCSACPKWPVLTPQAESLTKREYFAGLAMEGFCGRQYDQGEPSSEHIAGWSVAQADALIAALNAEPQP